MTVIRVVQSTTNDFGPHNGTGPQRVDTKVIWQGSDIDELSREYPPSQIFGADPLGHNEIEDGLIRLDYSFESQTGEDSCEKIDDPRRSITPMTETEREIDAENRCLYPGDYDDYCPDCGYANCQGQCEQDFVDDEEYERAR